MSASPVRPTSSILLRLNVGECVRLPEFDCNAQCVDKSGDLDYDLANMRVICRFCRDDHGAGMRSRGSVAIGRTSVGR